MTERLKGADPSARVPLLTLLSGARREARDAWPTCQLLLDDPDSLVRAAALEVLADGPARTLGASAARGRSLASDPSSIVRLESARFLVYCLDDEEACVRVLVLMISNGDEHARRNALDLWVAELLSEIAADGRGSRRLLPVGSSTVPVLMHVLADEAPKNRENACTLLGLYGAEASAATSQLKRLDTDPSPRVRKRAEWALKKIESALQPSKPVPRPSKPK